MHLRVGVQRAITDLRAGARTEVRVGVVFCSRRTLQLLVGKNGGAAHSAVSISRDGEERRAREAELGRSSPIPISVAGGVFGGGAGPKRYERIARDWGRL